MKFLMVLRASDLFAESRLNSKGILIDAHFVDLLLPVATNQG
jgi:hypothetical protein